MSGFLLDTNLVSELSRDVRKANPGVLSWVETADEKAMFLSVITLGEIRKGIQKVSDAKRRASLEKFLASLAQRFEDRLLVLDRDVLDCWGRVCGSLERGGVRVAVIDSLIGATALNHNLTVVSRDVAGFHQMGLSPLNPWS
ncbi:MAG: type II toxin-antitoxin system VapC family toxin [Candidatus Eremiobacteraeota bacterium]|nr:type II toxin-antitoxin system VapC family toxin [Candidatus Eremiobacteraeota bacterium]